MSPAESELYTVAMYTSIEKGLLVSSAFFALNKYLLSGIIVQRAAQAMLQVSRPTRCATPTTADLWESILDSKGLCNPAGLELSINYAHGL